MGAFLTLGHVNFRVRDFETSVKFYEALGFQKFLELTDEDHKPWIIYLRFSDELYLELIGGGKERTVPSGPTGLDHMCITVSNIEDAARELEAKGIKLMNPLSLKRGLDNNRGAWVEDPDGNRIELMEMAPDCVQYEAIKALHAGKGMTSLVRPLQPRKVPA
jgi:catechol 2,3-dioxygenase-like lactoylglutathione lyase family enzyme